MQMLTILHLHVDLGLPQTTDSACVIADDVAAECFRVLLKEMNRPGMQIGFDSYTAS